MLEAMLLGTGEPESWVMDWASPPAAWELPPPHGEELGAELGSLEEMGAAFTEPSLTVSSLGSWADECERADAALAAAKAQMGRGCPDESPGDATATAKAQLDEEDWEWLTALGAAMARPWRCRSPVQRGQGASRWAGRKLLGPRRGRGAREGDGSPQSWGARHQRGPRQKEAPPPQQPAGARRTRDPGVEGAEGRVDPALES